MAILSASASAGGEALARSTIDAAIHALDGGFIVAVPSDSGYALVADVSYSGSADRLFAIKHRSRDIELPLLVSDVDQAMSISFGITTAAERLMEKFWPGPLTLVVPRHPEYVADLGNDDETVGVRCPDHLIPRLLCEEVGPLATAGAYIGQTEPTTTAQVVADLFGENVELVIDGGECNGSPATVVDVTGAEPKLLREGAIRWADITTTL